MIRGSAPGVGRESEPKPSVSCGFGNEKFSLWSVGFAVGVLMPASDLSARSIEVFLRMRPKNSASGVDRSKNHNIE